MACEDLATQLFAFVIFHDHQDFFLGEVLEGEILVSCPLDVAEIGTDQTSEDRSPRGTGQRHRENSPDGEAGDHRHRQRDSAQHAKGCAGDRSGSGVEKEFAISVAFEHDLLTGSKSDAQAITTESGRLQVGDGFESGMAIRKDRGDVIVS